MTPPTAATTRTRRLEALVDGVTVLEGITTARPTGDGALIVQPEYLRAGVLELDPTGAVTVRPRAERAGDDDSTIPSLPRTVRIDPGSFCEVWIDGRLAAMRR